MAKKKEKKMKLTLKKKQKVAKKAIKAIVKNDQIIDLFRKASMMPTMKKKKMRKILKHVVKYLASRRQVQFEEDPALFFESVRKERQAEFLKKARQRKLLDQE